MQELINDLKLNNLKVTPQRLSIYSYLYNNRIHPSAEIIYNDIKEEIPTISLATVYKTLKSLKEANLIREINIGEDSFRYDCNINPHSHIICRKCNKINDYYCNEGELAQLKNTILIENDFEVHFEQVYFYGLCKDCRK